MTKQDVLDMLDSYRDDLGRCAHLEVEIAETMSHIQDAMNNRAEDAASPHAQQITGMPHGSGTGNPTEQIGIALASGYIPDYIRNVKDHLHTLQEEYKLKHYRTVYVSNWLSTLPEMERWIIEDHVIDKKTWSACADAWREKYGYPVSKPTLKRLKVKALSMIFRSVRAT